MPASGLLPAGLVGNAGGVVSGVINLGSSGASDAMMSITTKPASLLLAAEIAVDRVISMHALPTRWRAGRFLP
jgi:hypothetical protein